MARVASAGSRALVIWPAAEAFLELGVERYLADQHRSICAWGPSKDAPDGLMGPERTLVVWTHWGVIARGKGYDFVLRCEERDPCQSASCLPAF